MQDERCPARCWPQRSIAFSRLSLGDLVQVEAELCRQVGKVPEDVAQLLGEPIAIELDGIAVPDRLLVFALKFADLTGQAEERDHRVAPCFRAETIGGRYGVLVFSQLHGVLQARPGRAVSGWRTCR